VDIRGIPKTALRDDVLDLLAWHGIFLAPEDIIPVFNHSNGVPVVHGWVVRMQKAEIVHRLLHMNGTKMVRPHAVRRGTKM
jgi:hypothetical protein